MFRWWVVMRKPRPLARSLRASQNGLRNLVELPLCASCCHPWPVSSYHKIARTAFSCAARLLPSGRLRQPPFSRPRRKIAWASTVAGGGAVAGNVGSLGSDLGAPSGRPCFRAGPVVRFPSPPLRHLGDRRGTEFFVQNHVATLGTQRNLHDVRQLIHSAEIA